MEVRLEIERGSRQKRTFRMSSREMVIGRLKGCGLKIPSAAVSRRHCRLTVTDGLVHVEDLESANGTLVNGDPVQWSVLRPGDLLTVGPITFRVEYPITPDAVERILDSKPPRATSESSSKRRRKIEHAEEEEEVPEAIPVEESGSDIPAPQELNLEDAPFEIVDKEAPATEKPEVAERPRKKKKKKHKAGSEQSANPDYSMVMKDEGRWEAPAGEDVRDLLSQLEEDEEE